MCKTSVLSIVLIVLISSCSKDKVEPIARTAMSGDIQTIAGAGPIKPNNNGDEGLANLATFGYITGIAVDRSNNVYITDGAANTVRVINSTTQIISTIVGKPYPSTELIRYAGDGGAATDARLNIPLSVNVDASGNMVIADAGNNAIRYVSSTNRKISTLAGLPFPEGYSGDGGLAVLAKLWNPQSVATDATGNIYLADTQNNAIRKIDKSTGIISTIAGLGPDKAGYSGDGGSATVSKLNSPTSVEVDANGVIYICDNGNHVIRKISSGIISTFSGTGSVGYFGDGGAATSAKLSAFINGLAIDSDGNVYFADSGNNVIRKINSLGIISTVAGSGAAGYSGDGDSAMKAKLSGPLGVAIDTFGNIYIADTQNSVIRMVLK